MDQYEQDLMGNLQRLHARVHGGQYWPKPVLRTYIPKADGGKRPLGRGIQVAVGPERSGINWGLGSWAF